MSVKSDKREKIPQIFSSVFSSRLLQCNLDQKRRLLSNPSYPWTIVTLTVNLIKMQRVERRDCKRQNQCLK